MSKLTSKTLFAMVAVSGICSMSSAATVTLNGAGSSFIYPVMTKWTRDYQKATKDQINYQPIGSGGGITQLSNKTIDFAATDMPLRPKELAAKKWHQFPAVMGGIVPVINVKGITKDKLVLSGPVLAAIYLGQIKNWDAAPIKNLNKKINLPHKPIILVYRADGSGTTFNFTTYLTQVSPDQWGKHVGASTLVSWPAYGLGAKGNAGVANQVQNMPGSIGYVEYAYASQNNMTTVRMQNISHHVVSANLASFKAAASNANWNKAKANDFHLILTNQPGAKSWPIVATTYILFPRSGGKNATKQKLTNHHMLSFFMWTFTSSKARAQTSALDYVAIPTSLVKMIKIKYKSLV